MRIDHRGNAKGGIDHGWERNKGNEWPGGHPLTHMQKHMHRLGTPSLCIRRGWTCRLSSILNAQHWLRNTQSTFLTRQSGCKGVGCECDNMSANWWCPPPVSPLPLPPKAKSEFRLENMDGCAHLCWGTPKSKKDLVYFKYLSQKWITKNGPLTTKKNNIK